MSIAVVFDLTEKIDNFFENQVPIKEIVFDYYLNFIHICYIFYFKISW